MRKLLIPLIPLLAFASGENSQQVMKLTVKDVTPSVRQVIALQLKKPEPQINDDHNLKQHGADELDVVEIIMTLEEKFKVSINDKLILEKSHAKKPEELTGLLTTKLLAEIVLAAPKSAPKHPQSPNDGALHESQVGRYSDLAKLRNPNKYTLVCIPALPVIITAAETKLGRKLTDSEKSQIESNVVVIALSPENAQKIRQSQAAR